MRNGFTLVQISILLVVASLVMVTILPSTQTTLSGNNNSFNKMNNVLTAMRSYEAKYGALPCPADASQPISGTNYGIAAANSGTTNNCGGGTPAANFTDLTHNIAIGMVPVRALGLSNDYAIDNYGKDLTYAVDTNATVCGWPTNTLSGKIVVTDNGTTTNSVLTLVSHGADGHGAWIPLPGTTGTAARFNAGSTDTDQHMVNAHGSNGGTFPSNYSSINSLVTSAESTLTTFVRKPSTATFDDLVIYKSQAWNINTLPSSVPTITSVTPPANGTYTTGQVLTFTVNYSSAVTVTTTGGIPYLSLSAITGNIGTANLAKAQYASGSGSAQIVFTYTIVSGDTAPSGLTMTSTVTLNGGSIKSGNACAGTGFNAPNLSGVIVGVNPIYVADPPNHRFHQFSPTTGIWQWTAGTGYQPDASAPAVGGTVGQAGNGNGQFNTMGAIYNSSVGGAFLSVDGSGNVYEFDSQSASARIQEFSNTGKYLATPLSGLTSTGSGNFSGEWTAMAVDTAGNFYLADSNNARVMEYHANGTYWRTIGSGLGTGIGHFGTSGAWISAIAVDSNYIYVGDNANARIEVFKVSDGSYKMTIGGGAACTSCASTSSCSCGVSSSGIGYMSTSANGITVDSAGHVWVSDNYYGRVEEFDSVANSGGYIKTIGGDNLSAGTHTCTLCASTSSCSCYNGTANGEFYAPSTLATDGSKIYVLDTNNNRVQIFSNGTNTLGSSTFQSSIGGDQSAYGSGCEASPTYTYERSAGTAPGDAGYGTAACPADTSPTYNSDGPPTNNSGGFNGPFGGMAIR